MNRYFTKKEADTIITLISSKDLSNIHLGMNLLYTHRLYKQFNKCIVVRYKRKYIREYIHVSSKYSFKDLMNIYNLKFKKNLDTYEFSCFAKLLIGFINKRTFKNR